MKKVLYIHGKGGSPAEAEHYRPLFPNAEIIGLAYTADTPWAARAEFPHLWQASVKAEDEVLLIANSIGAFFAMGALAQAPIAHAYFISPIVDMEKLIGQMLVAVQATEDQLREKRFLETPWGEPLSWDYLCDVRAHPLHWTVPTDILYAEKDTFTDLPTVRAFAERTNATLTVMPNGEHWFHTPEQMQFLDDFIASHP